MKHEQERPMSQPEPGEEELLIVELDQRDEFGVGIVDEQDDDCNFICFNDGCGNECDTGCFDTNCC